MAAQQNNDEDVIDDVHDLDRDADLQAVHDAAPRIGADGVRALVDKVQSYRRSARNICSFVQSIQTNVDMLTNVAMLRAKLEAINQELAQWQWEIELDHIEARDFIE